MEETSYDPTKTAIIIHHSLTLAKIVTWKKPIQESNYEPSKTTMVVHYTAVAAPMDMKSLPIQEAEHEQTKSVMVITIPPLPTYVKTPLCPLTP